MSFEMAPSGTRQDDVSEPLCLAILIASSRPGRLGGTVARWFVEQAGRRDFKIDVIDLMETPLPMSLEKTPDVASFAARIDAADAFVVVTPEYNHGYPAAVKLAIDSVREEWAAKPVAFVSYGGLSGGLRAVEQLRLVCAELHMVSLRDTVSFHLARRQFDEHGKLRSPASAERSASTLLDRLAWWARTLRAGRSAAPYRA